MATPAPRARPQPSPAQVRAAARRRFARARRAEIGYGKQLRAVARQVGVIVRGFAPKGAIRATDKLVDALNKYSAMLGPWAAAVSARMVAEVGQRDEAAWAETGKEIGRALRKELQSAPTGAVTKLLLAEQVDLIQSIPQAAAQRVHKLTIEGMSRGTRAAETAKEIMRTQQVSESHAMLIARTETSRTALAFTEARARHVGSQGYIWRTAHDGDVRFAHQALEGTYHRWDDPPVASEPGQKVMRYHPGGGPNCRCFPEPVLPDKI